MHTDDLKAIWIGNEYKMKFVFHNDIEDHNDSTVNKMTEKVMLKVAPSAETL